MTDVGWEQEIAGLRERQRAALAMGGPDKIRIQHAKGKLAVRERIAQLLDVGSFREIGSIAGTGSYAPDGTLTGFSPSNLLFGRGRIDGRACDLQSALVHRQRVHRKLPRLLVHLQLEPVDQESLNHLWKLLASRTHRQVAGDLEPLRRHPFRRDHLWRLQRVGHADVVLQ